MTSARSRRPRSGLSADTLAAIGDVVRDARVARDLRDGLDLLVPALADTTKRNRRAIGVRRATHASATTAQQALAKARRALQAIGEGNPLDYELEVLRWLETRVAMYAPALPRTGRPALRPDAEALAYYCAQVLAVHGHRISTARNGRLAHVTELVLGDTGDVAPDDLVSLLRRVVPRARGYAAYVRREPGAHRITRGLVNPTPDEE